jgi:protein gp37
MLEQLRITCKIRMAIWSPWRGCHQFSRGCDNCYIHRADRNNHIDTNEIIKTDSFDLPIRKNKKNVYVMKPNQLVYLCFQSDFFIEEADLWREECWKMIKERSDLTFLFLTKRINRFLSCIPNDWNDGYDNVVVSCTVEDQTSADERLALFKQLPIKHKNIVCQPLLEPITISKYLDGIDLVVVGGESGKNTRPMDFDWVLNIRSECVHANVNFTFRQVSSVFIKDGLMYSISPKLLTSQARKANIDYQKA